VVAGIKAVFFRLTWFYGLVSDGIHYRFERGNGLFARFCFFIR